MNCVSLALQCCVSLSLSSSVSSTITIVLFVYVTVQSFAQQQEEGSRKASAHVENREYSAATTDVVIFSVLHLRKTDICIDL